MTSPKKFLSKFQQVKILSFRFIHSVKLQHYQLIPQQSTVLPLQIDVKIKWQNQLL